MAKKILGLFLFIALGLTRALFAQDVDALLKDAHAAEAKLDCRRALDLYLAADKARPNDPVIVQKIAQQYSDLDADLHTDAEKKATVEKALDYSKRAAALDPKNAVNVLSIAICYGKLGEYSDTRTKVKNSRLVKDETERALALDPNYAWAHHVLGRWNYEVATLGSAAKFFVKLFYGGLPDASTAEAVRQLQRAVELEPDVLAHQLELGFAYQAAGDTAKARAQFEKGLAMTSHAKYDDEAKTRARVALARLK